MTLLATLGWGVVHSLWLCTIIAGVSAMALSLLRDEHARARHRIACVALALMVVSGTSIDALSDSSVISGSSGLTLSPPFTATSMIGTSLKSPISGTRTSITSYTPAAAP